MKILSRLYLILLIIAVTPNIFAQQNTASATSNANAAATISRPLTYNKSMDSEDGNMFMVVAAMLEVTTTTKTTSGKGSIVLPMSTASFTAAIFNFNKSAGLTYNITVPETPLIFQAGSKTMKVTSMTMDPYLSGESGTTAGVYVSITPYDVTVNYN